MKLFIFIGLLFVYSNFIGISNTSGIGIETNVNDNAYVYIKRTGTEPPLIFEITNEKLYVWEEKNKKFYSLIKKHKKLLTKKLNSENIKKLNSLIDKLMELEKESYAEPVLGGIHYKVRAFSTLGSSRIIYFDNTITKEFGQLIDYINSLTPDKTPKL